MGEVLGKGFAANTAPVSLVLECAKRHWTDAVNAEVQSRKPIPARAPAGMPSYCQWLDAHWMRLFEKYRKAYPRTVHGMQRRLLVCVRNAWQFR